MLVPPGRGRKWNIPFPEDGHKKIVDRDIDPDRMSEIVAEFESHPDFLGPPKTVVAIIWTPIK